MGRKFLKHTTSCSKFWDTQVSKQLDYKGTRKALIEPVDNPVTLDTGEQSNLFGLRAGLQNERIRLLSGSMINDPCQKDGSTPILQITYDTKGSPYESEIGGKE